MPSGIFQNNSSQHYAGWILRKFFLKRSINRSPGNFNNLILDLPRQTVAIITKIHLFSSCLLNCCHMQSTLLKIHPCIGDTTIKKKKTVGTLSCLQRQKRGTQLVSAQVSFMVQATRQMQARLYYFSGERNHFILRSRVKASQRQEDGKVISQRDSRAWSRQRWEVWGLDASWTFSLYIKMVNAENVLSPHMGSFWHLGMSQTVIKQ